MNTCARIAALLVCGMAEARAVPMRADFSVTTDESGGRSFDADFSISPNEHLTLNVGAGHSNGSGDTANLRGTLLNGGASLHGRRGGVSLSYDSFYDRTNYRSATIGARAWLSAGDFEVALLARQRDMSVDLTLDLPLRSVTREEDFGALGGGLQVSYSHADFNAYALAVEYDYDDGFDRFLALTQSPQLAQRPRIEALVGSFITQAQGAIDEQFGLGAEQTFGRHSLALDLSRVRDAIDDSSSLSVALTYRYARSLRFEWSATLGMVDSDRYGGIGFVGMALGIGN